MGRLEHFARGLVTVALLLAAGGAMWHFWWRHRMHPLWVARRQAVKPVPMRHKVLALPEAGAMDGILAEKRMPQPAREAATPAAEGRVFDWANLAVDAVEKSTPLALGFMAFYSDRHRKRRYERFEDSRKT